jgi:hypothetical protein
MNKVLLISKEMLVEIFQKNITPRSDKNNSNKILLKKYFLTKSRNGI